MALPPLQHQINYATAILLVRAEVDSGSSQPHFRIEEIFKTDSNFQQAQLIQPDVKIFSMMGYKHHDQQLIVMFFHDQQVLELLPVTSEKIHYGLGDPTIEQHLSLDSFRQQVRSAH